MLVKLSKMEITMNKLTEYVSKHSIEYGSIPFWSWNDKLEPNELRRQIRNMHELEMRGFFMHARGGLMTEYMSDEWFECIDACVDEAKKLGMEAWAYDENGWPSGFAGGKVLEDPDTHAVYIYAKLGACGHASRVDVDITAFIITDTFRSSVTLGIVNRFSVYREGFS